MKRILCFIFSICLSVNVFAKCNPFDKNTCPKIKCTRSTIAGDDGNCYGCLEKKDISIRCIEKGEVLKTCPNRIIVNEGCGYTVSRLCPMVNCPKGTFMGDDGICYSCDEKKEISANCLGIELAEAACLNRTLLNCSNNITSYKCPDGFLRQNGNCTNNEDVAPIFICPAY